MPPKNPGLSARQGTVQAAIAAATETATPETRKGGGRRTRGNDDVPLSIRLPKEAHDELRRLGYEQRRPIHGMILEGIALFLEREKASAAAVASLR